MTAPGSKSTVLVSDGGGGSTSSVAVLPSNNKTPSHWVDVEAEDGQQASSSGNSSRESSRSPSSAMLRSTSSAELIGLPRPYLQSFHDLLIRNSGQSSVVFLNMPLPPQDQSKYAEYLECLEMITENMPPTLLVHGISSVISTALWLGVGLSTRFVARELRFIRPFRKHFDIIFIIFYNWLFIFWHIVSQIFFTPVVRIRGLRP